MKLNEVAENEYEPQGSQVKSITKPQEMPTKKDEEE